MQKNKVISYAAAAGIILAAVCLTTLIFGFSTADKSLIEIYDITDKIVYHDKELQGTAKFFTYGNDIYMPMSLLKDAFGMTIGRDSTNRLVIQDKPDSTVEQLKAEAVQKDARIKELEQQLAARKIPLPELEARINEECNDFEGVPYRTLLCGDEYEIRLKIEVDSDYYQREWNALGSSKKLELVQNLCGVISAEYPEVKIKGNVVDIARSRDLLTFYNCSDGSCKVGNYASSDKLGQFDSAFNGNYDTIFSGIHLTYKVSGNENCVTYIACIQNGKYGDKWAKLSDYNIKNSMRKLIYEILKDYKDAAVYGYIYDTDSGANLAEAWMLPKGDYNFTREK